MRPPTELLTQDLSLGLEPAIPAPNPPVPHASCKSGWLQLDAFMQVRFCVVADLLLLRCRFGFVSSGYDQYSSCLGCPLLRLRTLTQGAGSAKGVAAESYSVCNMA